MYFAYPAIIHSTVFEGKKDALELAASSRKTPRMRHIAVKYHFFREHVGDRKGVIIHRVKSKKQKSDFFAKRSPAETFRYIRKLLARCWL